MAAVRFEILQPFPSPAHEVWQGLIDWKGHEAWIPATKVEIHSDADPTAVGTSFTATTGFGRLALPDKMTVTKCTWDPATETGVCEVEKIGPILKGTAGFTVTSEAGGSEVSWTEDVTVKYLPRILAPVARWAASFGFRVGMRKLAKQLKE